MWWYASFVLGPVAFALHAHQPALPAKEKVAFVTMWLQEDEVPSMFRWRGGKEEVSTTQPPLVHPMTSPANTGWIPHDPSWHSSIALMQAAPSRMEAKREDGIHLTLTRFAQGLKDVGSEVPLVVIASSNFSTLAVAQDIYPNVVPHILSPTDYLTPTCNQQPEYALTYQKLLIFNLTEYDRLVWLDLDLNLKSNIDHMFDISNYDLKDGRVIYGQAWDVRCIGCPGPPDIDPARDNYWTWCHEDNSLCGGMLMFKPSHHLFSSLIDVGRNLNWCTGEDNIINGLLNQQAKYGYERHLFQRKMICFPQCETTVEGNQCHVVHDAWKTYPK